MKISSCSNSTYSLAFGCASLFYSFLPAPPKFFPFPTSPYLHAFLAPQFILFLPLLCAKMVQNQQYKLRVFSMCHYIYLYSFLSVDMLSQKLVILWKTQWMACNSVLTIFITPIVFKIQPYQFAATPNGTDGKCEARRWWVHSPYHSHLSSRGLNEGGLLSEGTLSENSWGVRRGCKCSY